MVDLTPELNYPAGSNFSYSLHVATGPTNRISTAEETMMKKLFVASLILSLSGAVFAAEPTAQQSKMKTCNADAAGKKGDERKAFMKECLSAKPAAPEPKLTQQDKMKKCNADATGKKGDERKAFMKTCLSNKS